MKLKTLAVLCSLAGLSAAPAAYADINIGVSLSSTGPAASLGIPEKNVLALLPTEVAGEKLNFVVLDDATDPSAATKNARKLVSEDKVDVLIGSSSTPASVAIAEVANESKTPQVAISPVALPADKDAWVFRIPHRNPLMAAALVHHMKATGVKKLGFIGYSDAYGEDWLNSVKAIAAENGIALTDVERYNRTDTSVSGQVLKLISSRPDAILIVGSGSPAALPQTALAERGYKGQIYQTHATANQAFLSVAGKAAEGTIIPVGPVTVADQIPDSHPTRKLGLKLVHDYEAKYGAGSFSAFAGYAFDGFQLIQAAIPVALKKAKPGTPEFRQALRDALESNKEVVGVQGVYNMSPSDHFGLDDRSRVLVRVEGGKFKLIER